MIIFVFIIFLLISFVIFKWFQGLPKSIPSPATPFQAKAIADMKQAVKEPERLMSADEKAIIDEGMKLQIDRLDS